MATFISAVTDTVEVHGTRQENVSIMEWSSRVRLRVPWTSRYTAVNDLVYNWYNNPWPYGNALFPVSVSISAEEGQYTQDGQGMTYEYAYLDVEYGIPGQGNSLPNPDDPTQLYSESIEPIADYLKMDYRRFRWTGAAGNALELTPDEAPGREMKGIRFVRTIYQLRVIPANLLTIYNTCNDRKYVSFTTGLTFEVETLLMGCPKISRSVTSAGADAWNLQLNWEYKPDGWNKFYRHETDSYEEIYDRKTKTRFKPVTVADHRPLLPG